MAFNFDLLKAVPISNEREKKGQEIIFKIDLLLFFSVCTPSGVIS